jgi:hypothetical protein
LPGKGKADKGGLGERGASASITDMSRAESDRFEKDGAPEDKAGGATGGPKPSDRELQGKLTELEGEKARAQRGRVEDQARRASEVSSLISRLKARDGEVRAHEAAHVAAGGRYITGGASYSYQKGPDGVQYAVGGEVGIDSAPVSGKPEETIAKMRIVRAAALAPAEPSSADLAVAGAAAQAEAQAVASLAEERGQKESGPAPEGGTAAGGDAEANRRRIDLVA